MQLGTHDDMDIYASPSVINGSHYEGRPVHATFSNETVIASEGGKN